MKTAITIIAICEVIRTVQITVDLILGAKARRETLESINKVGDSVADKMKKIAIGIIIFLLCVLAGVFLSGCDTKSSAKNKDIIEQVYGGSWIYTNVFRDTETGREYIVFQYGESVAVTPRLPKEDKE